MMGNDQTLVRMNARLAKVAFMTYHRRVIRGITAGLVHDEIKKSRNKRGLFANIRRLGVLLLHASWRIDGEKEPKISRPGNGIVRLMAPGLP